MKTFILALALGFTFSFGALAAPLASGKIVLPADLVGAAKGIRTVYISVYQPKHKGGATMPYGAVKVDLTHDPKTGEVAPFTLDTNTMMMMTAQEKLPSVLDIKVKLDRDGSAGPDTAGDIVGWARDVKVGTKNLVVNVDKEIR